MEKDKEIYFVVKIDKILLSIILRNLEYGEKFALLRSRTIHIYNALDLDHGIKANKKYLG